MQRKYMSRLTEMVSTASFFGLPGDHHLLPTQFIIDDKTIIAILDRQPKLQQLSHLIANHHLSQAAMESILIHAECLLTPQKIEEYQHEILSPFQTYVNSIGRYDNTRSSLRVHLFSEQQKMQGAKTLLDCVLHENFEAPNTDVIDDIAILLKRFSVINENHLSKLWTIFHSSAKKSKFILLILSELEMHLAPRDIFFLKKELLNNIALLLKYITLRDKLNIRFTTTPKERSHLNSHFEPSELEKLSIVDFLFYRIHSQAIIAVSNHWQPDEIKQLLPMLLSISVQFNVFSSADKFSDVMKILSARFPLEMTASIITFFTQALSSRSQQESYLLSHLQSLIKVNSLCFEDISTAFLPYLEQKIEISADITDTRDIQRQALKLIETLLCSWNTDQTHSVLTKLLNKVFSCLDWLYDEQPKFGYENLIIQYLCIIDQMIPKITHQQRTQLLEHYKK